MRKGRTLGRVLVTGAAGRIGTVAVAHLARKGTLVTALSMAGPFPPGADRTHQGDATVRADVEAALADVDAVVHLAAIPHPRHGTAYDVYRTNVTATFNVLDAAAEHGVARAVVASSINASGVPLNEDARYPAYFPIDEELPADIADPYSLSKLSDEQTCRMIARRSGMSIVALRFPLVAPAERLAAVAQRYRADPALGVKEGWSYLHPEDAAGAIFAALTADLEGAHVIGLAAAETLMDRPTMELLADFAPGVPVRAPIAGRGAAVGTARARTVIGFQPLRCFGDDQDAS